MIEKYWAFVPDYNQTIELVISADRKYIFACKFQLGNFK